MIEARKQWNDTEHKERKSCLKYIAIKKEKKKPVSQELYIEQKYLAKIRRN